MHAAHVPVWILAETSHFVDGKVLAPQGLQTKVVVGDVVGVVVVVVGVVVAIVGAIVTAHISE